MTGEDKTAHTDLIEALAEFVLANYWRVASSGADEKAQQADAEALGSSGAKAVSPIPEQSSSN